MNRPDPLIVHCGNCRSKPGNRCIGERGCPVKPHHERITYARFVAAERARGLVGVSK